MLPENPNRSNSASPVPFIAVAVLLTAGLALPAALDLTGLLSFFTDAAAAAVFAFAWHTIPSPLLFLSAPAAFAAAIALTGSPTAALTVIRFLPAAFLLAVSLPGKPRRCAVIIRMTAGTLALDLLLMVVGVIAASGSLTPSAASAYLDETLAALRGVLTNASIYNAQGELVYLYTPDQVESVVSYLMMLFPSILIAGTNVSSWLTTVLLKTLFRLFRRKPDFLQKDDPAWKLELSVVSAAVFVAAYVAAVLFDTGDVTPVGIISSNLEILLTPPFAYIGLRQIRARIRARRGQRIAIFYCIATGILFFISFAACLLLLAFFGVIETFLAAARIRPEPEP